MTDHHERPAGPAATPQGVSDALAQIAHSQRAVAQASVDLDSVAADLEVATIRVADLEDLRDPRLQQMLRRLRAKAEAWQTLSEALDDNARGSLSAADVCAVGFAQQEALAADHGPPAAQPAVVAFGGSR